MFQTFEQARHFLDEHGIQMVDLKFTDLWGRWHHLTVPSSQFTPRLMENGIGFDGSAVGLKSVKAGDMVLVPELSTGMLDPFWEVPTLSFICITLEADTHAVFTNDPRNIAIRAEQYLQSTGIADQSRWGPEFEFYIFYCVSYVGFFTGHALKSLLEMRGVRHHRFQYCCLEQLQSLVFLIQNPPRTQQLIYILPPCSHNHLLHLQCQ